MVPHQKFHIQRSSVNGDSTSNVSIIIDVRGSFDPKKELISALNEAISAIEGSEVIESNPIFTPEQIPSIGSDISLLKSYTQFDPLILSYRAMGNIITQIVEKDEYEILDHVMKNLSEITNEEFEDIIESMVRNVDSISLKYILSGLTTYNTRFQEFIREGLTERIVEILMLDPNGMGSLPPYISCFIALSEMMQSKINIPVAKMIIGRCEPGVISILIKNIRIPLNSMTKQDAITVISTLMCSLYVRQGLWEEDRNKLVAKMLKLVPE